MPVKHQQKLTRGLAVAGVAVVMSVPVTAALAQTANHADASHDAKLLKIDGSVVPAPRNKTPHIGGARGSGDREILSVSRVFAGAVTDPILDRLPAEPCVSPPGLPSCP